MAILDANDFSKRTTFITGGAEAAMRDGNERKFTCRVTAKRNTRNFLGLSLMLASDISNLRDIVQDGMLDTDDLLSSEIPSGIVSNNDEFQIVNVTDEQFAKVRPGSEVVVAATINEDDDGRSYINARVLEVKDIEEGGVVEDASLAEESREMENA